MTQCWRRWAEECFFERAPDRAVAGTIDNAEFYDLVLQQPQGPAGASLGRLGTGQGNQLGLPRLQYPARRALSFPNQRFKPFAFPAAQPHNILLYRNLLRSHDCLPRLASRWRRKRITK